jgi:hypothetical protein
VRNEIKTPGYSLVNLRTSYAWKQVRVDFGMENLFDKFYYLPTGGAYTGQGTTMTNPALAQLPAVGHCCAGHGPLGVRGLECEVLSPNCPIAQMAGSYTVDSCQRFLHKGCRLI